MLIKNSSLNQFITKVTIILLLLLLSVIVLAFSSKPAYANSIPPTSATIYNVGKPYYSEALPTDGTRVTHWFKFYSGDITDNVRFRIGCNHNDIVPRTPTNYSSATVSITVYDGSGNEMAYVLCVDGAYEVWEGSHEFKPKKNEWYYICIQARTPDSEVGYVFGVSKFELGVVSETQSEKEESAPEATAEKPVEEEAADKERPAQKSKLKAAKSAKAKIKAKAIKGKRVKLTWKKIKSVSGFEVYQAVKKKGKYKKVATINKAKATKWISKKLKKYKRGKKVFYKVRVFTKIDGKRIYGKWSNVAKAKIRK